MFSKLSTLALKRPCISVSLNRNKYVRLITTRTYPEQTFPGMKSLLDVHNHVTFNRRLNLVSCTDLPHRSLVYV